MFSMSTNPSIEEPGVPVIAVVGQMCVVEMAKLASAKPGSLWDKLRKHYLTSGGVE